MSVFHWVKYLGEIPVFLSFGNLSISQASVIKVFNIQLIGLLNKFIAKGSFLLHKV